MKKKIFVVAAHPDDEILGCGGALSRYAEEGHECNVLILAEGITSRDERRDAERQKKEIRELHRQSQRAAKIIGVKKIEFSSFPDNRMDSVDLLDVIKVVEKALDKHKPDIVFTHHHCDLNVDHRVTALAVETATRPMTGKNVSELYAFEVLSSTEWAFSNHTDHFHPNCFVDISGTIEKKVEAFGIYVSENRPFPHPRSCEAILSLAKLRGAQSGLMAAEAFCLVRSFVKAPAIASQK